MKKVLIVDDEVEIVELISMVLDNDDTSLLAAYDGEQALEIVREEAPDLVLSDVMMPRLDGIGLCRAIREDPAIGRTLVLLMTAARWVDREECGADGLIPKPFDILTLSEMIRHHLDDTRP